MQRWFAPAAVMPHPPTGSGLLNDPFCVEQTHDVIAVHLDPSDHPVMLWADAKPQVRAPDRTQPILPMAVGRAEGQEALCVPQRRRLQAPLHGLHRDAQAVRDAVRLGRGGRSDP